MLAIINILIKKQRQKIIYLHLGKINSLVWEAALLFDKFRLPFKFTVLLISYSVFSFSYSYIISQKFFSRFHILLTVFVLSILFLIFSSNLMFIILGWDGLGLSSYLLVIYYGRTKSYNTGILTVIRNRFGDFLLISCMRLLYSKGGWNLMTYKELCFSSNLFLTLVCVGVFTKSAQIPFSSWLPAAMAAPTPVSSLVHSSTLVTAGVYLIFRHLNTIVIKELSLFVCFVGISTIFLASMSAINEKDIKKMVALSTLRQLGLMVFSLGSGWVFIAFFHLIIHAFFKAIIFIRIGNIIHHSQLYQSIKNTGSIVYSSPLIRTSTLVASLRLCGVPFTAAFFSKEPVIEMFRISDNSVGILLCIIIRALLTLIYSSRLIKVVVLQFNKILSSLFLNDSDYLLNKGIFVLFIPSFIRGLLIFSFSIRIPHRFYYSEGLKLSIFSLFLVFTFIVFDSHSFVFQKGGYYVFSIWGLLLSSRSIFNPSVLIIAQTVNTSGFSFFLKNFLILINNYKSNRRVFMRTYFIYRRVSRVLVFVILVRLIL